MIKAGMQVVNIIKKDEVYKIRWSYPVYLMMYGIYTAADLVIANKQKDSIKKPRTLWQEHSLMIEEIRSNSDMQDIFRVKDISEKAKIVTQETVTPYKQYLRRKGDSFENVIKQYFELNRKINSFGFAETTFNFLINFGISKDKKPVAIDLGEYTTSVDEYIAYIDKKYWKKQANYNQISKENKEVFDKAAKVYFDPKVIKNNWRSALTNK